MAAGVLKVTMLVVVKPLQSPTPTTATTTSITTSKTPFLLRGGGGWVRRITSSASTRSRLVTNTIMGGVTKGSGRARSATRNNGGEEMSGWWRDGWRLISYAYFGGVQENKKKKKKEEERGGSLGLGGSKVTSFGSQNAFFSDNNNDKNKSNTINKGGGGGFVAAADMGDENHLSPTSNHQQSPPSSQHRPEHKHRLLTLPTILTLGRVAAVPILVTTFYMSSCWATTVTTSIFIVAAITDWLDGYLARKMRLGTPFGAFLDPVADKLMVGATLVLLCTRPLEFAAFEEMPWLLPVPSIAIICREITISAVREWAASQDGKVLQAVAVNNLGKWKTATQMIALTILLASRDSSFIGANILVPSGITLLYISAGLSVWSLAVYMRKIWRVLLKS